MIQQRGQSLPYSQLSAYYSNAFAKDQAVPSFHKKQNAQDFHYPDEGHN